MIATAIVLGLAACGGGGGGGDAGANASSTGAVASIMMSTAPVVPAVKQVGSWTVTHAPGTYSGEDVWLSLAGRNPLGPVVVTAGADGRLVQTFTPTDVAKARKDLDELFIVNYEPELIPYRLVLDAARNLIEDFDGCSYWSGGSQVSIPLVPAAGTSPTSVRAEGIVRRCPGATDETLTLYFGRNELDHGEAGLESIAYITAFAGNASRFQISATFQAIPATMSVQAASMFPSSWLGKVRSSIGVTRYDGGTAHFHTTIETRVN